MKLFRIHLAFTSFVFIFFNILILKDALALSLDQTTYDLRNASVAQSFTSFTITSNNSSLSVSDSGLTVTGTSTHPLAAQISNLTMPVGTKKWLALGYDATGEAGKWHVGLEKDLKTNYNDFRPGSLLVKN